MRLGLLTGGATERTLQGVWCDAVTVASGDVAHVVSGEAWTTRDLTNNGTIANEGEIHVHGVYTGAGTLINEGTVRFW